MKLKRKFAKISTCTDANDDPSSSSDKPKKKQKKPKTRTVTRKTGLEGAARDPRLVPAIAELSESLTKLMLEVSRFLNFHLLRLAEEGRTDFPRLDQTLIYRICSLVASVWQGPAAQGRARPS